MRALLGIAELHSMMASTMQAARRSAVASSWADAAVGSKPTSSAAVASNPLRILAMTISHAPPLWRSSGTLPPAGEKNCDGHHILSLFIRRSASDESDLTADRGGARKAYRPCKVSAARKALGAPGRCRPWPRRSMRATADGEIIWPPAQSWGLVAFPRHGAAHRKGACKASLNGGDWNWLCGFWRTIELRTARSGCG